MKARIDRVWLYLMVDADGNERVCAVNTPEGDKFLAQAFNEDARRVLPFAVEFHPHRDRSGVALDAHTKRQQGVVPCRGLLRWAKWMEGPNRRIAESTLTDGSWVSTVFLGIDHRMALLDGSGAAPILFETMVFQVKGKSALDDDPFDMEGIDQRRYCTRDEALAGHAEAVARWEGQLAETADRLGQLAGLKVKEPG